MNCHCGADPEGGLQGYPAPVRLDDRSHNRQSEATADRWARLRLVCPVEAFECSRRLSLSQAWPGVLDRDDGVCTFLAQRYCRAVLSRRMPQDIPEEIGHHLVQPVRVSIDLRDRGDIRVDHPHWIECTGVGDRSGHDVGLIDPLPL